jgi:hypothetical protein
MKIDEIEEKAVNDLHKSLVKYGADKQVIGAATIILRKAVKDIRHAMPQGEDEPSARITMTLAEAVEASKPKE